MSNSKNVWFTFLFLCILACSNRENHIRTEYMRFITNPIVIPHSTQSSLFHSKNNGSTEYRLVFYIDSIGCTDCWINSLAENEFQARQDSLFKDIQLLYIINVDSLREQQVLNLLYRYRIEGNIIIDTQKSLIHNNPHFPTNPLFHTFLLNSTDSVVLVGNPFVNERIKGLLSALVHHQKNEDKD